MATPTADKLKTYFPSRYIAADGNALTQYTVDSAAARTITDAALTESDDYWAGAIGWFDGDTLTPQLQSCFFHVRSFDATTDTLTLSRDLPAVPQAGDTFRLVIGGNRRSSQETFALCAAGFQPELQPVALANITGVTITKASGLLGEGDITLHYDATLDELYLKKTGEEYGVGLNVSGDITDGVIFAENAQSYLRVNVTAASLPVSDATEIVTLTCPEAVFTPDFEGYETAAGAGGKARYRLEVLRNEDPIDTMVDLLVYTAKPAGAATTITSSLSLTPAAGEFTIDNPANWPTNSFWVKNTTRMDAIKAACRDYLRQLAAGNPRQLVSLVGFSNCATLYQAPVPVGRCFRQLNAAIGRLRPRHQTNLTASIELALGQLAQLNTARGNLVVITDGGANEDTSRLPRVIHRAAAMGVRVFTIGVGNSGDADYNRPLLVTIARHIGGRFSSAHGFRALCSALREAV